MAVTIPPTFMDLFEKRAFAMFATLMADGQPQVTPVWCDMQDGFILVNSAKGRQKDRNVRRDPRVAITVINPDNAYRYLEIRGRVTDITEEGADAHIDRMAMKYLGQATYPYRTAQEVRVIYRIEPQHVTSFG